MRDMDGPTSYFFNLESCKSRSKQIISLRPPDGPLTSDPAEMRQLAVGFYSDLFTASSCDQGLTNELLQGLPHLDDAESAALDTEITLDELTAAVGQMALGRSPGLDGLPVEFYRRLWDLLGRDLCGVLQECSRTGLLLVLCRRAVLSLLPKKGDLTLLKNWRPVALLCTDYKLLSKVLVNRLKTVMPDLIQRDQSYCVPGRTIYF